MGAVKGSAEEGQAGGTGGRGVGRHLAHLGWNSLEGHGEEPLSSMILVHKGGEEPLSSMILVHKGGEEPLSSMILVHKGGEEPLSSMILVHKGGTSRKRTSKPSC